MSMAAMRSAIKTYLAGQNIPGVSKVMQGVPAELDPSLWNIGAQGGWGSVVCVHLTESSETRIALPRLTGQKLVAYNVGLIVFFRYAVPVETATALNGDEWVTGLDTTLEGLKAAIRADPHLGTGDLGADVFQAGEDRGDLILRSQLPTRDEDNGDLLVWNVLEFHTSENITA